MPFPFPLFYMPLSQAPDQRLVLIYAGDELSHEEIRAILKQKMDAIFVPRVLIHVKRLPRTENGKLPIHALDEVYAAWLEKKGQTVEVGVRRLDSAST